jgi:hypothetical protein
MFSPLRIFSVFGSWFRSSTAPVIPVLQSAEVTNDDPSLLRIYFSILLNTFIPINNSDYIIKIGGVPQEFDNDGYSPLTLVKSNTPFAYGDIVTVSYTAPLENPLQGLDGGKVASFVDYPVTNNIEAS